MITREDLLTYLGIDYTDDEILKNIDRAILSADEEIKQSVGENYDSTNPLAIELALMFASDFYENRGLSTTQTGNAQLRANQIAMKLKLKMRRSHVESV